MLDVKRSILFLTKIGFTKTCIANLLGTNRSRLNSWFKEETSPHKKNSILLNKLVELSFPIIKGSLTIRRLTSNEKTKVIDGFNFFKNNSFKVFQDKYNFQDVSAMLKKKYPYCQLCGMTGVALDAHHIVYRSEAPNHKALHSPKNLIILCRNCHEKMHKKKSVREVLFFSRNLHIIFKKHERSN